MLDSYRANAILIIETYIIVSILMMPCVATKHRLIPRMKTSLVMILMVMIRYPCKVNWVKICNFCKYPRNLI